MGPWRVELSEANAFVDTLHRHHKPVTGHRFSLGAESKGALVGVAICGRPVAKNTDRKYVLEVLRCCTDGTRNACSYLYGAAARTAQQMGFRRIQTFILDSEQGTTLEAAGWTRGHTTAGGSWSRKGRERTDDQPTCPKTLYYKDLAPGAAG